MDLIKTIACAHCGKSCYLKTGTKEGPTQGKSFYICPEKCSFSQPVIDVKPMHCLQHPESIIELQTLHPSKNKGEIKHYYRCRKGRDEKSTWCGHVVRQKQEKKETSGWRDKRDVSSDSSGEESDDECVITKVEAPRKPSSSSTSSASSERAVVQNEKPSAADHNYSVPSEDRKSTAEKDSPRQNGPGKPTTSGNKVKDEGDSTKTSPNHVHEPRDHGQKPPVKQTDTNQTSQVPKIKIVTKPASQSSGKEGEPKSASHVVNKPANSQQASHVVNKPADSQPGRQVVTVSASKLQQDRAQREQVERQLKAQQYVMRTVKLTSLPDGGAKIQKQVDDLTEKLAALDVQIHRQQTFLNIAKTAGAGNGEKKEVKVVMVQKQPNTSSGSAGAVARMGAGAAAVAQQGAALGMKQTKLTDHAVPLPSSVMQQLYAANPHGPSLYGGRMTTARLEQVGSVTNQAIEKLHSQLETCPGSEETLQDPEGLLVPLMEHQRQAQAWLTWREQQQPPGGILADDMGLGKTLTMISLVARGLEERRSKDKEEGWLSKDKQLNHLIPCRGTLLVCPASVIHQWKKEVERRCEPGLLKVLLYHGTDRQQDALKIADHDMVLTTYNLVGREVGVPEDLKKNKHAQEKPAEDADQPASENQPSLLRIAWHRIILDEGHQIKNYRSLTALSVCRLRARCRWVLTGTPIQNNLLDMYSLLRFLRCSPFDEFKVWKRQVDNQSAKGTQRLNTLVKSLLLRRTKTQVNKEGKPLVPLPAKKTFTHKLNLSGQEKRVYDQIYAESRAAFQKYLRQQEQKALEKAGAGHSNPWAGDDSRTLSQLPGFTAASQLQPASSQSQGVGPAVNQKGRSTGGGQILLMLLRLRQCCVHLSLLRNAVDTDALQTDGLDLTLIEQMQRLDIDEQKEIVEPLVKSSETANSSGSSQEKAVKKNAFMSSFLSSKIQSVMDHIKEIRKNSKSKPIMKSVVVSQWTKMLEVVESHLKENGFSCRTIKGNIPPKTRSEIVDEFNTDPDGPEVLLLSLQAGGVGLNLIGANHLFLLDLHWNPALEDQACDRIYRVGQKREVFIHRFICQSTVEEKIVQLQDKKRSLASNVLEGGDTKSSKLTLADLKLLFGVDVPAMKTF